MIRARGAHEVMVHQVCEGERGEKNRDTSQGTQDSHGPPRMETIIFIQRLAVQLVGDFMKLTEEPEIVTWPVTRYVFIEKVGPFQDTAPQAWQNLHQLVPQISEHNRITGYLSLYKVQGKVYRAGVAIVDGPAKLPDGVEYLEFQGGKYSRFVLTGPHSDLPQACGRVFAIVGEKKIRQRDDFCIENYANDPRTTPEEQLITQILIPTA